LAQTRHQKLQGAIRRAFFPDGDDKPPRALNVQQALVQVWANLFDSEDGDRYSPHEVSEHLYNLSKGPSRQLELTRSGSTFEWAADKAQRVT